MARPEQEDALVARGGRYARKGQTGRPAGKYVTGMGRYDGLHIAAGAAARHADEPFYLGPQRIGRGRIKLPGHGCGPAPCLALRLGATNVYSHDDQQY